MQISKVAINNFRGVKQAELLLPRHGVLIGDNNAGKTTVLEALDLVLGPDRLNRKPPVDEHDFYNGDYLGEPANAVDVNEDQNSTVTTPKIEIEVIITGLSDEQRNRFSDYLEFWCTESNILYNEPEVEGVDASHITPALRVTFLGWYDEEEDDFDGKTYFTRTLTENSSPTHFSRKDKQLCGFLYLRTIRTGSRALSLERGSLLDIVLRLKEIRPQMWANVLDTLSEVDVATNPSLGISGVLDSIDTALGKYVPKEWGMKPHLKISNLTREHLRKVITAFISTGSGEHAAPFYRQGTGTINMLVLAMLSLIAEEKQNVIFAMEEPETAIPPYAQKRIIHEVRNLSSQALFTSHSPYVLEEFPHEEVVVLSRNSLGVLTQNSINLPPSIKLKRYRQDFRKNFSEGLLAPRVLVAEGATEASAFPVVCRRLEELNPAEYSSLEVLGISVVDAGGESNISAMSSFYKTLDKQVFAICDKQTEDAKSKILAEVDELLMHKEKGFEDLVLNNSCSVALEGFANQLDWPQHLASKFPKLIAGEQVNKALREYFKNAKAESRIDDFLAQCNEDELPVWLKESAKKLKQLCSVNTELESDTDT